MASAVRSCLSVLQKAFMFNYIIYLLSNRSAHISVSYITTNGIITYTK